MTLCFIGSGIEREDTRVRGIEVRSMVRAVRPFFDTLVFGGSSEGLMEAFASAFAETGGQIVSVVPRWLEGHGLVYKGCEPTFCADLAERKHLMFEQSDAILVYPGGLGTWDELFDLLARRAVNEHPPCPPVFIYNWEKYYSPLLLQIETAVEVGLIHPHTVSTISVFESADALEELLRTAYEHASA